MAKRAMATGKVAKGMVRLANTATGQIEDFPAEQWASGKARLTKMGWEEAKNLSEEAIASLPATAAAPAASK